MIITCTIEDVEKVIKAENESGYKPAVAAVSISAEHLDKLYQVSKDDEDFNGTLARVIDAGIHTLIRRQAGAN